MQDAQMVDRILVIMAKAPRLGAVKTRLAQRFSPLAVCDLYRCLLNDTLALASALQDVDVAVMCPEGDEMDLMLAVGSEVRIVSQNGEGLAAGLTSVFAHFAVEGHRRVIAFNSDSPHLPVAVLEKAFDALASHDLVVGPTDDGGYFLVGAKASCPGLFAGDGMGTTNALSALLTRARGLGLSTHLTEAFWDVDVPADLIPLAAELRVAPDKAPRTAAWLKRWGEVLEQLRAGTKDL
jgi:uncharacterized protein